MSLVISQVGFISKYLSFQVCIIWCKEFFKQTVLNAIKNRRLTESKVQIKNTKKAMNKSCKVAALTHHLIFLTFPSFLFYIIIL